MILWKGHCSVHGRFTAQSVADVRERIPGVQVLVHPECRHDVVLAADLVGSTEFIIRTLEAAPAGSSWAIGTELNLVRRLAQEHPDKTVVFLDKTVCFCSTMNRIDLPHLVRTLEELVAGRVPNRIVVEPETARAGPRRARPDARAAVSAAAGSGRAAYPRGVSDDAKVSLGKGRPDPQAQRGREAARRAGAPRRRPPAGRRPSGCARSRPRSAARSAPGRATGDPRGCSSATPGPVRAAWSATSSTAAATSPVLHAAGGAGARARPVHRQRGRARASRSGSGRSPCSRSSSTWCCRHRGAPPAPRPRSPTRPAAGTSATG